MSWLPCSGPWTRFIAYLCRRGFKPAKRYAKRMIEEQIDMEATQAVLSACWSTGKVVYAHQSEDGDLTIEVKEDP